MGTLQQINEHALAIDIILLIADIIRNQLSGEGSFL